MFYGAWQKPSIHEHWDFENVGTSPYKKIPIHAYVYRYETLNERNGTNTIKKHL